MSKPKRIQRTRQAGFKMPDGVIYVGRPTEFGNPFRAAMYRDFTAEDAIKAFKRYVEERPRFREKIVRELKGRDLACWCKLGAPCHADVLIEIANAKPK